MKLEIGNSTIDTLIYVLQSAMRKAQMNMFDKKTKTNMSVPMDKWDCIVTRIYDVMNNDKYKLCLLDLSIVQIALIYELESKILFSIMRKSNYDEVLDGQKKLTHYSNAALGFNVNLPRIEEQLIIFDGFESISEKEKKTLSWKKDKMLMELGIEESDISSYVTVTFEEHRFALSSVQCFLTNPYYEVIDSQDWSDLIKPDDVLSGPIQEDKIPTVTMGDETPNSTEDADIKIDISIKKEKKVD